MISSLDRKLLRDLNQMKGQVLAIIAVMGCGIGIFIGWQSTSASLVKNLADYYESQRFGEVFASLNRAPLSVAEEASKIPGVEAVDARIVKVVKLDIATLDEPAVGKMISLPERGESKLNGVVVVAGRLPESGRPGEVIAEEAFVNANGFKLGDTIEAVLNGRLQTLHIVGIGMSPEYIITVQPGSIFPDDKRFGIFWLRRSQMEGAFNLSGAFNDLALSLYPGARSEEVILRLDRLLDRYGAMGANDRDGQLSHRFISDELAQLKVMTLIPPTIFLSVAAFLLNVVLRRILSIQRTQIAALKAFGYSSGQIGWHYGKLVAITVLGGALLGSVVGTFLGGYLADMYSRFYRFPETLFQIDPLSYVTGIALSAAAGFVGVFVAVQQAVNIQPAEAMRPEAPPIYRQSIFERLGWHRFLPGSLRMILRELLRRPMKAAITAVGIAFACSVLVIGNFGRDAIDFIVDFEFGLQQRHDVTINFNEAVPKRSLSSIKHIQGVLQMEPFRMVSARLRFGQRSRQLGIVGLGTRRDLFRLLDENMETVDIPPDGLVISSHLATIMHLKVGDVLTIEVLERERPIRKATVVATINDYSGLAVYMDMDALNRLMREPPSISGAFLTLDPKWETSAYRELKNIPFIGAVNLQKAAFQGFLDSFAENLLQLRVINVIFASVIAFGVVYNSALVALSERSRELATLRVIGFTKAEVTGILLGELAILTVVAIFLGWLIGYGLTWLIVKSLPTEHVRVPLVLSAGTYAFAAIVIVISALSSGLIVRRGVDRLNLVSVLKSRE